VIETCTEDGGCLRWTVTVDCADGDQVCEVSDQGAACATACQDLCDPPDATRCGGDWIQTCSLGTSGCLEWIDTTDCSESGQICDLIGDSAQCVADCTDLCDQEGASRCRQDTIQTCAMGEDGCLDWDYGTDCSENGDVCEEVGTEAQCVCVDACDPPGSMRCNGTLTQDCTLMEDGCTDWLTGVDCADSQMVCVLDPDPVCAMACEVTANLKDGGFEGGTPNPSWTEASIHFSTPICDEDRCCGMLGCPPDTGPVSGAWWAWFGGYDGGWPEVGTLDQVLEIPQGVCATLTFWLAIPVRSGDPLDTLKVLVDGVEVYSISATEEADAYLTYQQVEVSMNSFGDDDSHLLRFEGVTMGAEYGVFTSFLVDDVELKIGGDCCLDECQQADPDRCVGWELQACTLDGGHYSYQTTTDCALGAQECRLVDDQAMCVACENLCPADGDQRCHGDRIESCQAGPDTCLDWVQTGDCAETGQYCQAPDGTPACADYASASGGDVCGDPQMDIIQLPASLPLWNHDQTTCGALNDYEDTCMNNYDGGEDLLYQFEVTEQVMVNFLIHTKGTYTTGMALSPGCPAGADDCLFKALYGASDHYDSGCVLLEPGHYTLMVDSYPSPDCIPDFDLKVLACDPLGVTLPYTGTGEVDGISSQYYTFTLDQEDVVTLETTEAGTPWVDTRLWLRDSALTEIAYNDDAEPGNAFSRIENLTLQAGSYFVEVDAYSTYSAGPYTLEISIP
jgi:hypothetical protein